MFLAMEEHNNQVNCEAMQLCRTEGQALASQTALVKTLIIGLVVFMGFVANRLNMSSLKIHKKKANVEFVSPKYSQQY